MSHDPNRRRLLLIAAVFSAFVIGVPCAIYAAWGERMLGLGHHTLDLAIREQALSDYLRSPAHRRLERDGFEVSLFGDSTHFFRLDREHHLMSQLRGRIASRDRDHFGYYGLSHRAFSAWDYYLLLHRVAPARPTW